MYGFYTIHFICFQKRCKVRRVIVRFQEYILGSIFPMLQKIGGIILVVLFLNQTGMILCRFSNVPSTGISNTPTCPDLSL